MLGIFTVLQLYTQIIKFQDVLYAFDCNLTKVYSVNYLGTVFRYLYFTRVFLFYTTLYGYRTTVLFTPPKLFDSCSYFANV